MALTKEQVPQLQSALQLVSGFVPPEIKPYIDDVTIDGPIAFNAYGQIKDAIAKYNASPVKNAVAAVEAFGVTPGTAAHTLAELFDAISAQAKSAPLVPKP